MQKLLERKSYCTFNSTIVLAFGVSFVEGGLRCLPGMLLSPEKISAYKAMGTLRKGVQLFKDEQFFPRQ